MVNVTINGKTIQVKEGTSILQAAKEIDVRIPTLCHNPDLPAWASCGICIVRLAGTSKMIRACCTTRTTVCAVQETIAVSCNHLLRNSVCEPFVLIKY